MQRMERLRQRVSAVAGRMDGQAEARRDIGACLARLGEMIEVAAANPADKALSASTAAENKELKAMVLSLLRTVEGLADPRAAMLPKTSDHSLAALRRRTAGAIASARTMARRPAGAAADLHQSATAGASTLLRDMLREMTDDPINGRTPGRPE